MWLSEFRPTAAFYFIQSHEHCFFANNKIIGTGIYHLFFLEVDFIVPWQLRKIAAKITSQFNNYIIMYSNIIYPYLTFSLVLLRTWKCQIRVSILLHCIIEVVFCTWKNIDTADSSCAFSHSLRAAAVLF